MIWTEDLATSHAKMGLGANFSPSLSAAGTFQSDTIHVVRVASGPILWTNYKYVLYISNNLVHILVSSPSIIAPYYDILSGGLYFRKAHWSACVVRNALN